MRRVALSLLALLLLAAPAHAARAKLVKIGTFSEPDYVTAPPGDKTHLFVVERAGKVVMVAGGKRTTFLDITDQTGSEDEDGLLSIAFSPDFATSGRFYAFWSDHERKEHITEFRRTAPGHADPATARDLFVLDDTDPRDNGGQLQIGPDHLLYVSSGDIGGEEYGPGDPFHVAQDPASLFGKLLRIDPDAAGAQPEIFQTGMRNPWRFSFDRKTGALIVADVGQSQQEEIDYFRPGHGQGANLGWPTYEGAVLRRPDEPIPNAFTPTLAIPHSNVFCAIAGGYVSREAKVKATLGKYVFGDICGSGVWTTNLSAKHPVATRTKLRPGPITSFGQDGRARLYVATVAGPVYRIARRPSG